MRRIPGQAAIGCAMLLHWLFTLLVTLTVLGGLAVAAIAWRLSQGPVDLAWLTSRIEEAANANGGPTRLAIGSVALAWEGFRMGVDRPLDLRLTDLTVIDQAGGPRVSIPRADVSLSLYELLFWRIAPRAVAVEAPQLTLIRAKDGTVSLDLGSLAETTDSGDAPEGGRATPLADLLAELARPPANDRVRSHHAMLGQLRLVRIRDAKVTIIDRQLGATWTAPSAQISLTRRPEGGVDGKADLTLQLGEQQARLELSASMANVGSTMHVRARLSPVTPSALARAAPGLAPLAMLDAAVAAEATAELDGNLAVREARVSLHAGAGMLRIGTGAVAFHDAALVISGTPDAATVRALRVSLRARDTVPPTHVEVSGTVQRRPDRISAEMSVNFDQLEFADLAALWPDGTGGGAREWLVENIPLGKASNGHVDLGIAAPADFSSVTLTRANGTLDGTGLQVHWLRPIPPIDNGVAQLRILDPDSLEINVTGGRQRLRNQKEASANGLQIRSGKMRITGLMLLHQTSSIEADIAGPLADALALLREPRLALLDRTPVELKNPAGQMTVKLNMGLPLEHDVRVEDIPVRVQAHLDGVHLGGLVAGHDLDQGVLDVTAGNDGMKITGRALLAAIPTKLTAEFDFRAGPANQVVQTVTVTGQPDAKQLASIGLDATPVLSGAAQVQAVLTQRRSGQGDIAVTADLGSAELAVQALDWRKPRDAPAKALGRVVLNRDRVTAVEGIQLDGDGLALRGRAELTANRLSAFRIDRLALGRTVLKGNVQLPATGPIVVAVNGPTLDLAPRLGRRSSPHPATRNRTEPPLGPPWTLDARFDRVLMAFDRMASGVVLHGENDGRVTRRLSLEGRIGARGSFQAQIAPDSTGRRLTMTADDAGELLRGLDYIRSMQGGRLSVQANYNDAQPGRPLNGTADIEDFRVREAPALGKLLQAMTLYGLIEVLQGPGLGFSRLVAPFRLTDDALELTDARAFSSSLGLTMKGRLNLDADTMDMQGTIVPAYFFNNLLGNIPLVGKLFSPERGGGVFAASYSIRGRLDDPEVFVNPLAALTPGFLRGLFGLF